MCRSRACPASRSRSPIAGSAAWPPSRVSPIARQAAYAEAQKADPYNFEPSSNLGALLRRQGKYAEAATALEKAVAINPNDVMAQTLLKDVRDSQGAAKDQDKQKRIDALVDELAAKFKRGDVVRPPAAR